MRSSKYLVCLFYSPFVHGWWFSTEKDSVASASRTEFSSSLPEQNDHPFEIPSTSKDKQGQQPGGFRFFDKPTDKEEDETKFRNSIGGRSASGSRFLEDGNNNSPWWKTAVTVLPRIQCSVEPSTALKVKKNLRIFSRDIWIGAEYHVQDKIWRLQTSSNDGSVLFNGREIILYKSFAFSPLPDLLTRLRLRTTIDLSERHASVHLGFGTDQMTAVTNGLAIRRQFPIDKNAKLEIQAKVVLPTPEIEFSTKTKRSVAGMTNVEFSVDELNLLLEY